MGGNCTSNSGSDEPKSVSKAEVMMKDVTVSLSRRDGAGLGERA